MKNTKLHKTLLALTSSALIIPQISHSMAIPDKKTFSVRYSNYAEDGISASDTVNGGTNEVDRYDVDVLQIGTGFPLTDKLAMSVSLDYETMSGATPWYIVSDAGTAKVAMTGASVQDERTELKVTTGYYFPDGKFGFKKSSFQSFVFPLISYPTQ